MKTMILYASTYGFTKECAEKLKERVTGDVSLINAAKDNIPSVDTFDTIVIGSPIYIGQINKNIKSFCDINQTELTKKRLFFFLCCGLPENLELALKTAFPDELLKKAILTEYFGGELRVEKMKFFHKVITNMIKKATAKEGKPEPAGKPENIAKLANAING